MCLFFPNKFSRNACVTMLGEHPFPLTFIAKQPMIQTRDTPVMQAHNGTGF
jgi:hypothetical protein